MDENKEDKTGYTGEYGNPIDEEYHEEESSIYRYSSKDKESESMHSGDYYASEQSGSSTASDESQQQKTESANREDLTSSQQEWQQSFWSQENLNQNYNHYQGNKDFRQKDKKPMSFGKRICITIVCAIIFGVIASACFNGVNNLINKNQGQELADGNEKLETTGSTITEGKTPVTNGNQNSNTVTDVSAIAEQCMPAVVAITSTTQGTAYYDLFGQYYAGKDTTSSGTGFIVGQNSKELLIATNNHVIDNAKTISVQFIDGEIYEATQKGSDTANDLAVVAVTISKIKKSTMNEIKIADLGDSDSAKVGEMVIAIGNALGYGQSVTVGYISAKDREIRESADSKQTIKALQTDAAINPGNSGGALINMRGQVIGINSAKIASSEVEGVGYAIPISVATPIIDDLMNREVLDESEKGYLGISGQTVSEEASVYNVPYGVYVKEVAEGGAAEKAGIKVNDVITAINKMEVTTIESLQEKVNSYRKGTKIEITLQRANNGVYEEKKVTVTLQGKESLDSLENGTGNGDDNTKDIPSDGDNIVPYGDEGNNQDGNDGQNGDNGYEYDGRDNGGFGSFWNFFR